MRLFGFIGAFLPLSLIAVEDVTGQTPVNTGARQICVIVKDERQAVYRLPPKPVEKPAENTPVKPAEKPAEKTTEKTTEKITEKPADSPVPHFPPNHQTARQLPSTLKRRVK